jgi:hypothetical protein
MKAQEAVIGKGFGKFALDLFIALYGVPGLEYPDSGETAACDGNSKAFSSGANQVGARGALLAR